MRGDWEGLSDVNPGQWKAWGRVGEGQAQRLGGQTRAWAGGEEGLPRRTADKLAVPRRGGPPCRVTWVTSQMTWERTSPGASASLVVLEML